jgi:hypothetical protein
MANETQHMLIKNSLFAAALAVTVNTGSAQTLVLDTFNTSGQNEDINFELSGRQFGTLAPITYTEAGPGVFSQVNNPQILNTLLLAGSVDGFASVSLNRNFVDSSGLGGFNVIRFLVDPLSVDTDPQAATSSWVSVVFGKDGQNPFVNSPGGFGVLFRGDGRFQAFSGGDVVGEGPGLLTTGFNSIELRITDLDGNAFDGTGTSTIAAFANSVPLFTTAVPSFNNNFISFLGESDNGRLAVHYIDNVEIGVVPEPSTAALLVGSFGMLTMFRRRIRNTD